MPLATRPRACSGRRRWPSVKRSITFAIGALAGAFASLFAGLCDRFGRANLMVFGLLIVGLLTLAIPHAPNKLALVAAGLLSDRPGVRKPFMLACGLGAAVLIALFLLQAGQQPNWGTLVALNCGQSALVGFAYTTWMASFTETVAASGPPRGQADNQPNAGKLPHHTRLAGAHQLQFCNDHVGDHAPRSLVTDAVGACNARHRRGCHVKVASTAAPSTLPRAGCPPISGA